MDKTKLEFYAMIGMIARIDTHDYMVKMHRLQCQLEDLKLECNSEIITDITDTLDEMKMMVNFMPDLCDLKYKFSIKIKNDTLTKFFSKKYNKDFKGEFQVDIRKFNLEVRLPRVYYSVIATMIAVLYITICNNTPNSIITVSSPNATTLVMTINETIKSDFNHDTIYEIDESRTYNDTFIYKTMFNQIGFDFEILPESETTSIRFFKV
jgi:hypothetical protein